MNKIDPINRVISNFSKYKIAGYLISSKDEYQSEYTSENTNRIKFLTGFSGSFAIAIIFETQGIFFTDGRYIQQAKQEIDTNFFTIVNISDITNFDFSPYVKDGATGYNPKLFTKEFLRYFSSLKLLSIEENLIDNIWTNRPKASDTQYYLYNEEYAGLSFQEKIIITRNQKGRHNYLLITNSESVCWLLNIRGADQEFCPIVSSYALISDDEILIFANVAKVSSDIIDHFSPIVSFIDINVIQDYLLKITQEILVDKNTISEYFASCLKNANVQYKSDIILKIRAEKTDAEINWAIQRHIEDAVALCECFAYLDNLLSSNQVISEYELSLKLTHFRKQSPNYISDSFANICGYNENSAIIHYRPTLESSKIINSNGMLLIDSGGHYLGATTDVTRTLCLSDSTKEQRLHYTLVLKGHIAIAKAVFAVGTSGANLDILARQYLWNYGLDYGHGTGHGVGNCLNVHEGPHAISRINNVPLKPNMIVSNEPGYYIPGHYGIRIENLCFVTKSRHEGFVEFENLTLMPFEPKLIDKDLLTREETEYIKQYYREIEAKISPLLSYEAKKWLINQLQLF